MPALSGEARNACYAAGCCCLGAPGLALLALCVQLFPLSDFRHVLLTPCAIFAAEVLSQRGLPGNGLQLRHEK